ncbi:MAG: Rieske (2Fe-2S) protein [Gaiellaceae bacterium]
MTRARRRVGAFPLDDLPPGERRIVGLGGLEVGVFNLGDRLVAYRNYCPHQGAPVCLGRVGGTALPSEPGEYVYGRHGRILVCPWHGWEFDLDTGRVLFNARARLAAIEVTVEEDMVILHVSDGGAELNAPRQARAS